MKKSICRVLTVSRLEIFYYPMGKHMWEIRNTFTRFRVELGRLQICWYKN